MDFTKQEFAAKVQTQTVAGRAVKDETEKKVALTFDDDVIIGLSQEISYKEAVSMIQSYFRYSKESRQGSAVILKSYSEQPGSVNIRDIG